MSMNKFHCVSGHGVFAMRVAPGPTCHDLASSDSHMRSQGSSRIGGERRHRALDCERREDRSFRIVAVSNRSAEDRHDAIADMLVDMATVILDDAIDLGEESAEKTVNLFLVELAAGAV
jgi:hypothetical protein